ncbi:hypothetical protein B296_00035687 [Ensete ventricosum]|uniref:Uncharacterized protein n=1 Tax=Ensete ventricosum TaxID=4639 RepID=A0A426ZA96_ENSVE|nr:hypothetical protein B296_00035687 [Ensete ventricosum]
MDPARDFVKSVKRLVIKVLLFPAFVSPSISFFSFLARRGLELLRSWVGTAVVTRTDGRLALGRLGNLCEQVLIY